MRYLTDCTPFSMHTNDLSSALARAMHCCESIVSRERLKIHVSDGFFVAGHGLVQRARALGRRTLRPYRTTSATSFRAHWLRHTAGSHMMDGHVELRYVRDNPGDCRSRPPVRAASGGAEGDVSSF
jgi:hypothetical protein